jgi:hypothetical protein
MEEEKRRYVGIDLGKREYAMAIIKRGNLRPAVSVEVQEGNYANCVCGDLRSRLSIRQERENERPSGKNERAGAGSDAASGKRR